MAYGVVRVCIQHGWQIALFKMPNAIVRKNVVNLFHEIHRTFQIVEHSYGSHDFCGPPRELFIEQLGGKEIGNQLNIFRIESLELRSSSVDAHSLLLAGISLQ